MMEISKLLFDYDQIPNLTFHQMNKRKDFILQFKKQLEQWNTHLHDIVHNGQLFANSIQKLSEAVSGTIDYVEDFPEVVHEFLTLAEILNHISGIHKTGVLSIQEAFTSGFEELQSNRINISSNKLSRIMDLMYEYGQVVTTNSSKKGREAIAKQGSKIYNADSLQLLTKPGHFDKLLMENKKQYIDAVNQENQAIHIELIDKIHSLYYSFHTLYAQTLKNINRFEGHIEISSQKNAARNIELTRRIKELRNVNATSSSRRSTIKLDSAGGNTPEGVLLFQKKKATDFKLKYFWVHKKTLWYGKLKKKEGKVELEKKQALMSLFLTNAKPVSGSNQLCFEILSPESKENFKFIAGSEKDLKSWIERLNSCSQKFIEEYTPSRATYVKMRSNSSDFGGFAVKSLNSQSPEPFTKTQRNQNEDQETKSSIVPFFQDPKTLADRFQATVLCGDCGAKRPIWMSSTFLVPLCLNCSSFHRQMGPKVSRVKSVKLDKVPSVLIETAISLYQKKVFQRLEETMPASKSITEMEKQGQKQQFYFSKYEAKKYIKPPSKPTSAMYLKSIEEHDILKFYSLVITDPLKLTQGRIRVNTLETTLLHQCAKSGFIEGLVVLFFHTGQSLDVLDSNHCNPSDVALVNNQVDILEVISILLK